MASGGLYSSIYITIYSPVLVGIFSPSFNPGFVVSELCPSWMLVLTI